MACKLYQLIFFLFLFFFLGPVQWHMEAGSQARGGIRAILLVYTTATAMPDPTRICNLHLSSQQRWIFNPLTEARD